MITLHVPQPQLLLTPLVFYNMLTGKITLIGEIPGSYNVFDMSDKTQYSQSSLLSLRGAILYLSSSRTPIGEACPAFNGNITLPDQFSDLICCR